MKYKIICNDYDLELIERLLKVRWITDNKDLFLNANIKDYWIDPFKLNDMWKSVDRIFKAISNWEKIMIFGDYDVDWITSSFILYDFIKKYLWYKKISIQYPNRKNDWYWIKNKHIDEIKWKWVSLIITVDNWITSVEEWKYAKKLWIDMIITDHHHKWEKIPQTLAVVNPKISSEYNFKDLAGVWVAFKLISALLTKTDFWKEKQNEIFKYYLPIVAIWTVADVVPLVWENRTFVKKWLELINKNSDKIHKPLKWFIDFLNIKNIDTFHIWFMIWPRINASWRMLSPYESLYALMYEWEKQYQQLKKIEELNTERKKIQDAMLNKAKEIIDLDKFFLSACSDEFHEWIVWIVSGRITEKYNKPSMIVSINKEKNIAVWSLRWPSYFSVIDMLQKNWDLMERFWWHSQAWWLSVKLENLEKLTERFEEYCKKNISEENLEKQINIDTKILKDERNTNILQDIEKISPFGEWNQNPIFLIENIDIEKVDKVWKNWNWHIKIHWKLWWEKINVLFWKEWNNLEKYSNMEKISVIWYIKKDNFNWWYFVEWKNYIDSSWKIID